MNPHIAIQILHIDDQLEELNRDWYELKERSAGSVLKKEIERLKQEKIELYNQAVKEWKQQKELADTADALGKTLASIRNTPPAGGLMKMKQSARTVTTRKSKTAQPQSIG